jgi:UDP-glucose 4-epimerase
LPNLYIKRYENVKKILITGADGFVGSSVAEQFVKNGDEVLAIDLHKQPVRLTPGDKLEYRQADIGTRGALLAAANHAPYDTFVHFAWAGSAGPQRSDYALQMQNALTAVECLKDAKALGCSRFVCAGSIMEREAEAIVRKQNGRPGMAYIYGIGKYTAHCLCKAVAAEVGINLIWPMITNAYGEGELSPRFVNTTIRRIVKGEPLQFTSATQNYDFVHISDVARAFYLIAHNGKPFYEYLIGSGRARPLKEFILEMVNELAPDTRVSFGDIPFTGVNMPLSSFDTSNTQRDCGFEAQVSFAQGTRRTLAWLKAMEGEAHD